MNKPIAAGWLALLVMLLPYCAFAQRPPVVVPVELDTVLERLPPGYASFGAFAAERSATAEQILATLDIAAQTGDTRLSGRADRMLQRHPQRDTDPSLLLARAFSAQHRHDFETANGLLTRLVQAQPRDGTALFSRAQVFLVQGRMDRARADCAALTLRVDAGLGVLCTAAISLRTGNLDAAARFTQRWLDSAGTDPLRRYALVMRGEIATRAGDQGADRWYREALAQAPDDVRTLAAYARHLRATARPREVVDLLAEPGLQSDGLLLQRALAAREAQSPLAGELQDDVGRRFELAHAADAPTELRDEAEYLLTLRGEPAPALALALRNFQTQRDAEDVDLLSRAARAADDENALRPMRLWAQEQRLSLGSTGRMSR